MKTLEIHIPKFLKFLESLSKKGLCVEKSKKKLFQEDKKRQENRQIDNNLCRVIKYYS